MSTVRKSKAEEIWMLCNSHNRINPYYVSYRQKYVWEQMEKDFQETRKQLKNDGFRVIKVRITPL